MCPKRKLHLEVKTETRVSEEHRGASDLSGDLSSHWFRASIFHANHIHAHSTNIASPQLSSIVEKLREGVERGGGTSVFFCSLPSQLTKVSSRLYFIPRLDKHFWEEICVQTVTQKCVELDWVYMRGGKVVL